MKAQADWLWGALLVAAIVMAYQPAWRAGFIWDDTLYIEDPSVAGWGGLKNIWATSAFDVSPLASTTLWLERSLWGLVSWPYHLVSILMHAGCALALWRVLRELRVPGAWLGAALWALHPVQVESVAWASELKNPESGVFFLLAILFFIRWHRSEAERRNYVLAILFGALAMLCKSSTVVLPVVLLLGVGWMEGRWRRRDVIGTLPFFAFSAAAAVASIYFEANQMTFFRDHSWVGTWPERLVRAGDAVWFYAGKLVWPHPLATVYPGWRLDTASWISYLPLLAVSLFATGLFFLHWRACFFAFTYFVVALLPVLGLGANTIFQYAPAFDHFQYLASMGPLALAGAALFRLGEIVPAARGWRWVALSAGVVSLLAVGTWERAHVYRNGIVFWSDAMAKNPESWLPYSNLAQAFLLQGRLDEALDYARHGIAFSPSDSAPYFNLGDILVARKQDDEALEAYRRAEELDPTKDLPYSQMGAILLDEGKTDEAIAMLNRALAIGSGRAISHQRMGAALARKGDLDRALLEYELAVMDDPSDAASHFGLANVFTRKGQFDRAMAEYEAGLEIDPGEADAHNNLGNLLLQAGRMDEAAREYEAALAIAPKNAMTHNNLGAVYFRAARWDDAVAQFQQSVALQPDSDLAHFSLGFALARKGELDAAIAEYQKALALNPNNALARTQLAAVLSAKKTVR